MPHTSYTPEVLLEAFLGATPDAAVTIDSSGTIQALSPAAEEMFGYAASELEGCAIDVLIPTPKRAAHRSHVQSFVAHGDQPRRMGDRMGIAGRRKDGTVFPADVAIGRRVLPDGDILMTAVIHDLSTRPGAEHLYRAVVEETNDGIVILQGERIVFANPAALDLIGYAPGEQIRWADLIAPEERDIVVENNRRRLAGENLPPQYEVTLVRRDGERVVVEIKPKTIEYMGEPSVLTFLRDVTPRRRAEAELRERDDRLAMLVDESPDGIVTLTPEAGIIDMNPAALELLGYRSEELRGKRYKDLVEPSDQARSPLRLDAVLAGEPVATTRPLRKADGSTVWINTRAKLLSDGRILLVQRDITNQRLTEDQLRRRERELARAHEIAHMGTWFRDTRTEEVTISGELMKLFGGADPQFPRERWLSWLGGDDRDRLPALAAGAMENGQPFETEFEVSFAPNKTAIVHLWAEVEWDDDGAVAGLHGVLQDVTEQRRLEQGLKERDEQLLQSQRLDSLGRLAGGIAHDFNNLLAVVIGNVGFLQMTLAEEHTQEREVLEEIEREAMRAADLIKQLLAFSKNQTLHLQVADIGKQVREFLPMARVAAGESIGVESTIDKETWPVVIDPVQLDQVLMNLVVNARDAMPDGGTITIAVENTTLSGESERFGLDPGEYLKLCVSDTGERDDGGNALARLRPVLHHKALRERHWTGACDRTRDYLSVQRPHFSHQQPRKGKRVHRAPSPR